MPKYQTAEHKQIERAIALEVAAHWDAEASEFPPMSPIDFYLHREGLVVALLEIRDKRQKSTDHGGKVLLDLLKVWRLVEGSSGFNAEPIFAVQFTDGLFTVKADEVLGIQAEVMGRKDRNDPFDVRPCLRVPLHFFSTIRRGPAPPTALAVVAV